MYITNLNSLEKFRIANKQKNYTGAVLSLAEEWKAEKLGFHAEIIDPKKFSCPYHYHTQEEELFYVLEGEAVVRCNNEYFKVGPGDLFFYKTGQEFAHNIYNHTDKAFKFLAISNNAPEADICHYPDSKKVSSPNGFLQNNVVVNYFKDEEDPARYWPEHILAGKL